MQNPESAPRVRYRERLSPSLWFVVSLAVAGPMAGLTFVPLGPTVGLIVGIGAVLLITALALLGSPSVHVEGTTLRAGRAHIDARFLQNPRSLTGEDARHARGPGLSARSWHLIRGGIDGLVVVDVTDPADPVTAWTISSRTPDRLAAAIARAIAAAAEAAKENAPR